MIFLLSTQIPTSRTLLFDLGKTEAFFISFSNGSKCLVNTGRHFPNNQAYWIIRSFLMARAVHRLDGILLTQVDAAHAGGLRTILDYVRTNRIFVGPGDERNEKMNKYAGYKKKFQILTEGSRIQFGSNSNIYIQLLTFSKGRVTSFLVNDQTHKMLFVLSADPGTFKALSSLTILNLDFIYLPHHEFEIGEVEKNFLKQVSSQYIVSNQRSGATPFLSDLNQIVHCPILSIEREGAVEFMKSRRGLAFKCFGVDSDARSQYLIAT